MKKLGYIIMVGATFALFQITPANADGSHDRWRAWYCDYQPVQTFWEEPIAGQKLSGSGHICGTPWGLNSSLKVKGLTPGNAYTVWWTYIDDPDSCQNFFLTTDIAPIPADEPVGYAGKCGIVDFGPNPLDQSPQDPVDPLGVFGRMDSAVAYRHRARFEGDMRGFVPSPGSQVWMWVFGHGPADEVDNKRRARQLLTPEDPTAGAPHLGIAGQPFGYPAGVVVFQIPDDH